MIAINVVGVGHWGLKLLRVFADHPDVRVRAVCDISRERLGLAGRRFPTVEALTTDPLAAATDPAADAVIIATPVTSHYQLTKAALEAGKHVLVEKPLCDSVEGGEELVRLARRRRKHLCVGHVFLFNNAFRYVRNVIRSGDLGTIRHIHSTRTNLGPFRHDVNVLWDLAAHDVCIFNHWLEAEPLGVTARGQGFLNPEIEDVVVATFTYPKRVMACAHVSWFSPRKTREITIVGSRKMVVWDDMNSSEPVRIYRNHVTTEHQPLHTKGVGTLQMTAHCGSVVAPTIASSEPLAAECDHFIKCVKRNVKPINDGEWGLAVLRALEAASRSMREQSRQVALTPAASPFTKPDVAACNPDSNADARNRDAETQALCVGDQTVMEMPAVLRPATAQG